LFIIHDQDVDVVGQLGHGCCVAVWLSCCGG
jgi:hypothetical protein